MARRFIYLLTFTFFNMTYKITRNGQTILETEIYGRRTKQAPTVDFIDVDFQYPYPIQFLKNDVLTFQGQDFFLDETSIIQKEGLNTYNYRLKFLAKNYRLAEIALLGYDSENKLTLPSFKINANLRTLLDLVLANAIRVKSEQFDEIRKVGFVKGYQLDSDGSVSIKSDYNVTNYIEVKKGEKIALEDVSFICFYDTDKKFLSAVIVGGGDDFTSKQDGFIRVDWFSSKYPHIQKAFISLNIPDTPLEYFEVDNEYVSSFLGKLSGTFNLPFTIDDNVITFGENNKGLNRTYTHGKELTDITNKNNENHKLVNVVYASGSEDNLPSDYGSERLIIPPLRDNDSINRWGECEGFYRDEDLKPTTSGKVLDFYDAEPAEAEGEYGYIEFVSDLVFETEEKRANVNFTSGDMNGKIYPCVVKKNSATNKFHVMYFLSWGQQSASGSIEINDTFFISNIKQPPEVVTQAEKRLKEKATEFLNESSTPYKEIDVNVNPLVEIDYGLNYSVRIVDKSLKIDDIYNIVGYTETLDKIKEVTLELSQKKPILKQLRLLTPNMKLNEIVATTEGLQQQINELNKP